MNTFVFVFVTAVAVLSKSASANCIPNFCCGGPIFTPFLPTTTILKTNTVTESLVDVVQTLPVINLLNNQLSPKILYPPVFCPCNRCPCNCGCGCNSIFF